MRQTGEPDLETGHTISTNHWSGTIFSLRQAEYSLLPHSLAQSGASFHRSGPTPLAPGEVRRPLPLQNRFHSSGVMAVS